MTSLKARILMFAVGFTVRPHYKSAKAVDKRVKSMRAAGYRHEAPKKLPKGVTATTTMLGECATVTLSPEQGAEKAKHLCYLHGGAYLFEAIPPHWESMVQLVARAGVHVHMVQYPLAPEAQHAEILSATRDAYLDLTERLGEPPLLAGDSAGAGLSLRLAQALRDDKLALPSDLILISPWLDCSISDPRSNEIARRDPMLHPAGLRHAGQLFAGSDSPDDPSVSPLFGTMDGLPKMHIFNAGRDTLMPDGDRLHTKLTEMNIPHHYHFDDSMCHCWPLIPLSESKPVEGYLVELLSAA